FLYPIGSFMEDGGPTCAIGACGVSNWPVYKSSAQSLDSAVDLHQSKLWNVDASNIIFSHTDIYKGRIANLVWELIALPPTTNKHQMGETAGIRSTDKSIYQAFLVDEFLGKGNWVAAEKWIREIAKQE